MLIECEFRNVVYTCMDEIVQQKISMLCIPAYSQSYNFTPRVFLASLLKKKQDKSNDALQLKATQYCQVETEHRFEFRESDGRLRRHQYL